MSLRMLTKRDLHIQHQQPNFAILCNFKFEILQEATLGKQVKNYINNLRSVYMCNKNGLILKWRAITNFNFLQEIREHTMIALFKHKFVVVVDKLSTYFKTIQWFVMKPTNASCQN